MVHFLIEALFIGVITALVGLAISTLLMYTRPGFSLKQYKFWPLVLLSFFVTGFVMHIGFELIKLNKWYCHKGYACSK